MHAPRMFIAKMKSSFVFPFCLCFAFVSSDSPVSCTNSNVACDVLGDNVLDSMDGVATVEECRQLCYDSDDCHFITYYGPDSFPYKEFCYLFSACEETHV